MNGLSIICFIPFLSSCNHMLHKPVIQQFYDQFILWYLTGKFFKFTYVKHRKLMNFNLYHDGRCGIIWKLLLGCNICFVVHLTVRPFGKEIFTIMSQFACFHFISYTTWWLNIAFSCLVHWKFYVCGIVVVG